MRAAYGSILKGLGAARASARHGWHILKLLAMRASGPLPLPEAKAQIVAALRQARAQRMVRAYLDDILKAQPIQLNEIELTNQVGK